MASRELRIGEVASRSGVSIDTMEETLSVIFIETLAFSMPDYRRSRQRDVRRKASFMLHGGFHGHYNRVTKLALRYCLERIG
jgi:hypothetical protein